MEKLSIVIFICMFFFFSTHAAEAKVLPQAKSSGSAVVRASGTGISVSPRLRADRNALVVTFGNLQNATSVSYTLIYTTNGEEQGAGGTLSSSSSTASRELLFGTCSGSVCRYHQNISAMRFEVTSALKSGKKTLKRYRIKI